ncbi:hypothetical protein EON82_25335 [bacterium]|nr:MAG: hypothetical protein EON82_25335 [bacterium]
MNKKLASTEPKAKGNSLKISITIPATLAARYEGAENRSEMIARDLWNLVAAREALGPYIEGEQLEAADHSYEDNAIACAVRDSMILERLCWGAERSLREKLTAAEISLIGTALSGGVSACCDWANLTRMSLVDELAEVAPELLPKVKELTDLELAWLYRWIVPAYLGVGESRRWWGKSFGDGPEARPKLRKALADLPPSEIEGWTDDAA